MYDLWLTKLEVKVNNVIALAEAHRRTPILEIIPTPIDKSHVCSKSLSTNPGAMPATDVKTRIAMYTINEGEIA